MSASSRITRCPWSATPPMLTRVSCRPPPPNAPQPVFLVVPAVDPPRQQIHECLPSVRSLRWQAKPHRPLDIEAFPARVSIEVRRLAGHDHLGIGLVQCRVLDNDNALIPARLLEDSAPLVAPLARLVASPIHHARCAGWRLRGPPGPALRRGAFLQQRQGDVFGERDARPAFRTSADDQRCNDHHGEHGRCTDRHAGRAPCPFLRDGGVVTPRDPPPSRLQAP
mmetsp:Transcript_108190/g.303055  ORF Transcript_108190/g.303055 Transcript_108190/m.303055 type:complete len:224 (-) Transcript_108190:8-679(-)